MTTENDTLQGGGGQVPPAENPPKSDAEAAQREAQQKAAATEEAKPPQDADKPQDKGDEERKRNRTREYIQKINRENAELRRKVQEIEARMRTPDAVQPKPSADREPTLEDYDFDVAAFTRAHAQWAVRQELKTREEREQQERAQRQQEEVFATYETRVVEFAEEHPDFLEVVGSIAYPLPLEVQLAIAQHELGPQIAYHLGKHDDDAFQMALIRPDLAAAAVERLAKRIGTAPPAAALQGAPGNVPNPKPITQAPPPVPRVGGRAPTEIPPEKMTDEQWYEATRAKRGKRG